MIQPIPMLLVLSGLSLTRASRDRCFHTMDVDEGNYFSTRYAVDVAANYKDRIIPWDFDHQPLTFMVKMKDTAVVNKENRLRLPVVMVLRIFAGFDDEDETGSSRDFMNCHLTSSCSKVLTCCYRYIEPDVYARYQKSCPVDDNCRWQLPTKKCRATCFPQMVMNVVFGENVVDGGGLIEVSA